MSNDPQALETYSRLTNSLQTALLIAGERATAAREAAAECDRLYNEIARAAEAARQLRAGSAT